MTARDVYVLLAEWCIGSLFWPYRAYRRRKLRRTLRQKMQLLGMIPPPDHTAWLASASSGWRAVARAMRSRRIVPALAVTILGTAVPKVGTAQAPDSLIGTALSRAVIPAAWNPGLPGIYCLTWIAQKPNRPHLLVVIDAEPADLTQQPICPDPEGGFYPFWIDGPTCPPGNKSPFPERDFVIIRCADGISRYNTERPSLPKKAQ